MSATLPSPAPNNRVCFMGPTGSGKTELARALLKATSNVIVIDPKREFDWKPTNAAQVQRFSRFSYDFKDLVAQLRDVERKGTGAPIVYRPNSDDFLPRNIGRVDAVFYLALQRGHTTVYVDEMSYLTGSSSGFQERIPFWFRAVTTGRSRGVGVWSSFQRPSNVPLLAMSESDYRIAFFLRLKKDQARAEELCGPIDWQQLAEEPYSFVWATDRYASQPVRLNLNSQKPPAQTLPASA